MTDEERLEKVAIKVFKQHWTKIIRNLEIKYKEKYGREFHISDEPAMDGTLFGYALDLSRCIGCRRCVYGCVKENNL